MNGVTTTVWSDVLDEVRRRNPELLRAWFGELAPARLDRGVLEIHTRNEAQARYLEQQCRAAFVASAQAVTGRLVSVNFVADESEHPAEGNDRGDGASIDDRESAPDRGFTFANFATGACNQLAHAAAIAAADDPGGTYNPLLIHGPAGLGKTHLLQAICHRATERSSSVVCRYVAAGAFIARFTAAFESETLHAFRSRYREVDLLAIDDIQVFAGRERSQEELFHTVNALLGSRKQIALAADRPPGTISGMEERLTSRFSAGLVAMLDPPCMETRLAILASKVRQRCIEVPEDALRHLAQRITSSGFDLENALLRLDAVGQANGGCITMDLVAEVLR